MTVPQSSSTQTGLQLSFPPLSYAKLAPHSFLTAHLTSTPALRPNTRQQDTFRSPTLHSGSLTHAHGSAVVRVGNTACVCGVKGEILKVEDIGDINGGSGEGAEGQEEEGRRIERLGLLVPNVELNTGCNPLFMPGAPPSTLAQTLADRVRGLLYSSRLVGLRDLEIWRRPDIPVITKSGKKSTMALTTDVEMHEAEEEDDEESEPDDTPQKPKIKAFWTLYIDILFISLDGNPFDAAWAAVLAALQNTKLPRAWWDTDAGTVLCSPLKDEAIPLGLRGCPIASTFGVFEEKKLPGNKARNWVLADPDDFEESLCDEMLTVVVDGKEREKVNILRIEKSGGGALGIEGIRGCVVMAEGRWREWGKVLREEVERQKR